MRSELLHREPKLNYDASMSFFQLSFYHRTFLFLMSVIFLPQARNCHAVVAFSYRLCPTFRRRIPRLCINRMRRLTAMPTDATTSITTRRKITDLPGITPELWSVYEENIREVSTTNRGLRNKLSSNIEPITNYLCSDQCLLDVVELHELSRNETKERLRQQRERFKELTGFSSTEYDFCSRCLTYLGDVCARKKNPRPLIAAWYKMKECGMLPRENGLSTYMYALSLDEAFADVSAEVASLHDLLYEPNEKTITLRIKELIFRNDALGAEKILASLPVREPGLFASDL